jgi:hypothetical protein
MRTAGPELRLAAGASGDRAVDRAWAAHRIALDLAAVELTGALRAAGVDAILLKGPVTAARQWPARFRPTLDLDLMVAPARFETALACLAGRGFTPIAANERATALHRDRDAVTVDLHRTLPGATVAPERAWAELARRRVPFPLAGAEVAALDEAAHACHLAMHAAQTGGTKPKPAADLDWAVARVPRATWAEARAVAGRLGALEAMAAGLRCYAADGPALADALGLPGAAFADQARAQDPTRWTLGLLGWWARGGGPRRRAAGWPRTRAWRGPGWPSRTYPGGWPGGRGGPGTRRSGRCRPRPS